MQTAHHLSIHDKSTLMLSCRAAAKINLSLEVLSRREDGYHVLKSVACGVGLWDSLHFEFGIGPGFSLRSNWPALMTEDNLCLRAARAWAQAVPDKTSKRFDGIRITLQKTIPMGSGLGGGSSDAAATLLALNQHYKHPLDHPQIEEIALSLGADVPFFVGNSAALMEGVGEKLTPLVAPDYWAVLICPNHHSSTAAMFAAFDVQNRPLQPTASSPSDNIINALEQNDVGKLGESLHNDLLSAVPKDFDPQPLLKILQRFGAAGASMSGSGSTVFGLYDRRRRAQDARSLIAEELQQEHRTTYHVFAVPLLQETFALVTTQ